MKHFYLTLPIALAALVLLVASPSAFAAKGFNAGMSDPTGGQTIPPPNDWLCDASSIAHSNQPCQITSLGAPPYTVTFLDCAHETTGVIPNSVDLSQGGTNYTGGNCLWLANNSGSTLTAFSFTMPVPTGLRGDTITCQSAGSGTGAEPAFTATGACAQPGGLVLQDSGTFTLSFLASAGVVTGHEFFLFTDFNFDTNPLDPASVTVGVPEPGELGLFGLGLLGIGVGYGWKKRRQGRGTSNAA